MGFGTMLMKFTALDGFLLNLVSRESGSGKTTILQSINSVYGRPKELLLSPKDTYTSRMQRLGTMQSFAVTMDEIAANDYSLTPGRYVVRRRYSWGSFCGSVLTSSMTTKLASLYMVGR
jgi:energy-coupling factor transporter ATP-binding protein EcfA2